MRLRIQKEIHKELMPIAWHPLRWWDWCMKMKKEKKRNRKVSKIMRVVASSIRNKMWKTPQFFLMILTKNKLKRKIQQNFF